jgi:hypothetical protein
MVIGLEPLELTGGGDGACELCRIWRRLSAMTAETAGA